MPYIRLAPFALLLAPLLPAQASWTLQLPTNSPPALTAHTMNYFLPTDSTVLFGGVVNGVRSSDTWSWNGSDWTQLAPATVPPARVAHSMVYDPGRGRLVMFGGIPAGGGLLGDTWEWDGADWIQMTPVNSPSPRRSYTMAYYPPRGTVILWGGYSTMDHNDTWEWNGLDWSQIVTTTSPGARRASDMAFDPVTGSLILFSGYQQINDTWRFDGSDWALLAPSASPPSRFDHSMVTDLARNRIVMFGQLNVSDTWEWDGSTWLNRAPATLPTARIDTYLAYDMLREQVVMFGSSNSPETWIYAPTHPAQFQVLPGNGCAGTTGQAPQLVAMDRPWLGEVFEIGISQLPAPSITFMLSGLSDSVWSLGALPAPLAAIGMPGCDLMVDPLILDAMLAPAGSAVWQLALPLAPTLLGVPFYSQCGALDAGANPAGIIVGNHGVATLGGK